MAKPTCREWRFSENEVLSMTFSEKNPTNMKKWGLTNSVHLS